jgi:hypothetical protein
MLQCVVWYKATNISEALTVSIIRVTNLVPVHPNSTLYSSIHCNTNPLRLCYSYHRPFRLREMCLVQVRCTEVCPALRHPDIRVKHCAYGHNVATLLNPRGVTTVSHKYSLTVATHETVAVAVLSTVHILLIIKYYDSQFCKQKHLYREDGNGSKSSYGPILHSHIWMPYS